MQKCRIPLARHHALKDQPMSLEHYDNRYKNLGFAVLDMSEKCPDLLAVVTDKTLVNYKQLGELIRNFAARMQALGVRRGSAVALESEDILIVIPVFMATALLGAQWIAFKNYKILSTVVQPTHWFRGHDGEGSPKLPFVLIDDEWVQTKVEADVFEGYADPETPFLYANTSGTTGTPKLLTITQRMMFDRAVAPAEDFVERKTVFCSLFTPTAYPYIARFVAALKNGATIVHSQKPEMWYACGVNHLYGSVTQVTELLGKITLPRKLPMIHVSGSKCGDQLALHLLNSFEQVVDLYASTETNRSFKNIKYLGEDGKLHTKGKFLDSEVEIVDDAGKPVPAGEVGLVRVRNSYLVKGYLNSPEAEAKAFRDGWFFSGDFGTWGPEGGLQVLGRTGDVINKGGIKVSALAIDEVLREAEGVADAMCFDNPREDGPSEILAFVVFAAGKASPEVIENINRLCAARLGAVKTPSRIIETNMVPRAHDGGAQRFICHEIYQRMHATTELR